MVQPSRCKPQRPDGLSLCIVLQRVLQLTGTEPLSTRVCPDPRGEGEPGSASALFALPLPAPAGLAVTGCFTALLSCQLLGQAALLPVLVLPAWIS